MDKELRKLAAACVIELDAYMHDDSQMYPPDSFFNAIEGLRGLVAAEIESAQKDTA